MLKSFNHSTGKLACQCCVLYLPRQSREPEHNVAVLVWLVVGVEGVNVDKMEGVTVEDTEVDIVVAVEDVEKDGEFEEVAVDTETVDKVVVVLSVEFAEVVETTEVVSSHMVS